VPPSAYRIRKARRPDQLSTFEAACHALLRMGERQEDIAALLNAFEGFVSQQQSYIDRKPPEE
jgi:DTW domain-containing protein YfiP